MKKLLSVLSSTLQGGVRGGLLFLLLIANVSAIYASDTQVDGIWYDFDSSTKTASVTYRGYDYDSYDGEYSGSVIIPETVTYNGTTYSVTSIGYGAFAYCSSLTSVTIPESVTSIGYGAFADCSSLTSVTIPNSVTNIEAGAFIGCSYLTSVTIPNSVTSIGDDAFSGCSSLTSVTIGESVTSIGNYAFYECTSLTSVTIGESVTSIGNYAFYGCSSLPVENNLRYADTYLVEAVNKTLSTYSIKEGTKWVGDAAFYDCSSLTSVTIGESVTSIGEGAFGYCSSLTSVTIPNSVTSIGNRTFCGCDALTSMVVESGNATYDSRENCNAIIETATNKLVAGCQNTIIPNSVTSIGNYAFYGCSSLTSVTIPNSVTSIEGVAFYGCSSLTSVTIPNSVTSIGAGAFGYCSSLTSVTIGESVTSIGESAFYNCSSLTSMTIGESVTSIGHDAFFYCSSLTSVTINSDAIVSKDYSYTANISDIFGSQVTEYIIGESVTSIGKHAFSYCSFLTSVTIGESVTSIGNFAFVECSSLIKTNYTGDIAGWCNIKFGSGSANPMYYSHNFYINDQEIKDLVIPNSVDSIHDYAFSGCSSLTSVTIPNSVTSIGSSAFNSCSSLTSVTINSNAIVSKDYSPDDNISDIFGSQVTEYIIGNKVKGIGDYAFYECTSLTSVTIGESVTSIGNYAFYGCSSLPVENNLRYADTYLVEAVNKTLSTYSIKEGTKWVGDAAFYDCSSLTSVTIGESVTSIGEGAFGYCSSLTSVTIPNSVTSIGDYAFYGCSKLTPVTIPESVTSIGSSAFADCSSLTSVTINSGAIVSKDYSYNDNISHIFGSQVTEYIIGESVTSIGDYAFKGCSSLISVTIGNSVTSIGERTFYGCSSLTAVTIPNSVISIGGSAFYDCSSLTKTNYTGDIAGWCNIRFYDGSANPMWYSHNFYINDQKIKDLVIPNNVTSIGDYAFVGYSSLTSVTIPESVTSIGNYAFSGCSSLPVENNLRYADTYLVEAVNKTLSTYSIKEGTKWVGDYAFYNCSSLTSVTIPNSVTSIGEYAFEYCSSLTSVTIPNSVTNIGDYAFYDCSSLTSVTIGESVTSIGSSAFYHCSNLTSVTIGESVTSIGDYAFYECSSLTSITCKAATPPTIDNTYTFYDISTSIPVYVPCGCVEAYKAASGWEDFTNIQESLAEYSIEVYVNDTIMGSAKVDKNTLCDACISATPNLGYHFVQWNDGNTENPRTLELTQDTILTAEFAQSFFGQCGDNLYWSYDETAKTISITGSGEMYDYTADTQPWLLFKEQIVEVTTTNTVTSIGTSAFEGCARLSKVSLGTGLEEIAANAFAGCTRLYDVYCYATNPPFAEQSSFANYNVYLYVPCESQRNYTLDVVWGNFKFIECIESEDVSTDGVVITPTTNDVTIIWPTEIGADTYTIVIKKGDTVFCTLTFNADGQLLNIAFAPGRDGNHPAQYAEQAGNGYRFTVTGLEEATHYSYNIDVKNAANNTIKSHSGEFTTMGDTTTAVEDVLQNSTNCKKILRDNQLLILRDGKTYTIMGTEVK